MSRFYSQYEIDKFDKQLKLQEEALFSGSTYRSQLKDAINIENHRTNVDSAKKKAVIQGMNYDGFHQMVLGANLKGVSKNELLELKPNNVIMNSVMTQIQLGKEKDVLKGDFISTDNIEGNVIKLEEDKPKVTLQSFKRSFKYAGSTNDKIGILLGTQNFDELINNDILESDIFLELIYHIGSYFIERCGVSNDENIAENKFLIKCLDDIINNKTFTSLKKFIGKKQKNIYIQINENDIKSKILNNLDDETISKFDNIISKLS